MRTLLLYFLHSLIPFLLSFLPSFLPSFLLLKSFIPIFILLFIHNLRVVVDIYSPIRLIG